jgi:hypothetical protein
MNQITSELYNGKKYSLNHCLQQRWLQSPLADRQIHLPKILKPTQPIPNPRPALANHVEKSVYITESPCLFSKAKKRQFNPMTKKDLRISVECLRG